MNWLAVGHEYRSVALFGSMPLIGRISRFSVLRTLLLVVFMSPLAATTSLTASASPFTPTRVSPTPTTSRGFTPTRTTSATPTSTPTSTAILDPDAAWWCLFYGGSQLLIVLLVQLLKLLFVSAGCWRDSEVCISWLAVIEGLLGAAALSYFGYQGFHGALDVHQTKIAGALACSALSVKVVADSWAAEGVGNRAAPTCFFIGVLWPRVQALFVAFWCGVVTSVRPGKDTVTNFVIGLWNCFLAFVQNCTRGFRWCCRNCFRALQRCCRLGG